MNKGVNECDVLDSLLNLYRDYSSVNRRTISFNKFQHYKNFEFRLVSESLIEHVGNLPIIATFLYPHLEKSNQINIGNVLEILAVHDIGETIVGDAHPHTKTEEHIKTEAIAALKILPSYFHETFNKYEEGKTLDAKYAKAVDVFSTFLCDLLLSKEIVQRRLANLELTWAEIEKKRAVIFSWDPFLEKLFLEVSKRYKKLLS